MQVHIKPLNGLIVRDPITAIPLHAAGEHKPLDAYWARRIAEGSVTEIVLPQPTPTSAAAVSTQKAKPNDGGI